MSSLPLAKYEQALLAQRAALLAQIAEERGGVISRAEVAAEQRAEASDDWGTADAERSLAFTLGERETAELGALDAALARIRAGEYGLCVDCGAHIPARRLDATPEASRCIPCQETTEKHA